jgi:ABC-2 type transport system ATP-binding protein
MDSRLVVEFEHVSKRFGKGILALDDATWAIRRGARACLLGPNGAGKSTSIRLLQGALQPTRGRVALLGAAVDGAAYPAARRRTGVVPQGPGMYRDLTTGEYLELARRLYRRGDVPRALAAFGLEPHRDKMLAHLSGGFQRRVCLAAALLAEPDLLLLDEPTVGLDPLAAHDVHATLREAMEGRTTLLCTHNLAEAEALCDEVVILRAGKVLLHEPLAALRRRARPRVRLAAQQGPDALLAALRRRGLEAQPDRPDRAGPPGQASRPATGPRAGPGPAGRADGQAGGVLVALEHPQEAAPALLRGLLADGLDVYECRPVQATLEQLFLEAVTTDHGAIG